MTIGERIQVARKSAGLTQKELGEKLGLSYQSIAQWENDIRKPKIANIIKIANVLDVPISDLSDDISAKDLEVYRVLSSLNINSEAQIRLIDAFSKLPEELYGEAERMLEEIIQNYAEKEIPQEDPEA